MNSSRLRAPAPRPRCGRCRGGCASRCPPRPPCRTRRRAGRGAVLRRQARAVEHLDAVDPRHQRGDVRRGDLAVDARRDVVERGEDALLPEIRQQLADVVPQPLDLAMLRSLMPSTPRWTRTSSSGNDAGDFAADDDVGTIGDGQRAVDRVVIGDRDEIHPARLGAPIDALGRVVRLVHDQRERIDRRAARVHRVHVGVELHAGSSERPWGHGRTGRSILGPRHDGVSPMQIASIGDLSRYAVVPRCSPPALTGGGRTSHGLSPRWATRRRPA